MKKLQDKINDEYKYINLKLDEVDRILQKIEKSQVRIKKLKGEIKK